MFLNEVERSCLLQDVVTTKRVEINSRSMKFIPLRRAVIVSYRQYHFSTNTRMIVDFSSVAALVTVDSKRS